MNEKFKRFLPQRLSLALEKVDLKKLYEIRIRKNRAVIVIISNGIRFLCDEGLTQSDKNAIKINEDDIRDIVYKISGYSVYSINEELKSGFITFQGLRIGITGRYVMENNSVMTIKNISSLCIRIPHRACLFGKQVFIKADIKENESVLISSPPGCGKTTLLREFVSILNQEGKGQILICDERGEICEGLNEDELSLCDVAEFCDKSTLFLQTIRAMRPNIIVTDELVGDDDEKAVKYAIQSGVRVFASIHAKDVNEIGKVFLSLFDKIISLSSVGEVEKILTCRQND